MGRHYLHERYKSRERIANARSNSILLLALHASKTYPNLDSPPNRAYDAIPAILLIHLGNKVVCSLVSKEFHFPDSRNHPDSLLTNFDQVLCKILLQRESCLIKLSKVWKSDPYHLSRRKNGR